jgi:23S rRNA maturation mini-RNase III
MLSAIINLFLGFIKLFDSLSDETKAKIINIIVELFDELLRTMYKTGKNADTGESL